MQQAASRERAYARAPPAPLSYVGIYCTVQAAHNKHKTASILRNANGDLRTRTPPSQDSRGLLRHGRRQ